ADNYINESVVIHIEQSHSIVSAAFRISYWYAAQQVLIQLLQRLLERQELHLLAMLFNGVVDQLDDLFVLDPAVRVEDEAVDALLDDGAVERRLEIADGDRAVRLLVVVLGRPVAGGDAGELPAELVDDVRIRIILDGVDERAIVGNVLPELVAAVGV